MRYSGISLGYQGAGVIGGALAPLIATALVSAAGGESWLVAGYLLLVSLITLLCVYLASDAYNVAIHDDLSEERA